MSTDPQDTPQLLGEITHGPSAFEQFLDRNQKNLIILSIAIALGVAGYLVYQGIASSKERSAGADFCEAEDLPALQSLIKEYPNTAAAGTAEITLAERQWTDGQQGASIETLKTFIRERPNHPARYAAKASLAAKLKDQGKTTEATPLFQELSTDPDARYLAPYALISLGDLAKSAGKLDQAEKSYQNAKTVVPGNSFSTLIDQRLANLKTKPPVEIDPPPAPPVAPVAPGLPVTPGTPLIPGLPPSGLDTSDTDVPAVDITNPGTIPAPPPIGDPAPPVQDPPPAPRTEEPPPAPADAPADAPATPPADAPAAPPAAPSPAP